MLTLEPSIGGDIERKVINYGTITWTKSDLTVKNGGAFNNEEGAFFYVHVDKKIEDGGGAGWFTNAGLLDKRAGMGTATIEIPVDNTGKIKHDGPGTLKILKHIAMSEGEIELGPSGHIILAAGLELGGTSTLSNKGTLEITGDFVHSDDAATTIGDKLQPGSITVTGAFELEVGTVEIGPLTGPTAASALSKLNLGW